MYCEQEKKQTKSIHYNWPQVKTLDFSLTPKGLFAPIGGKPVLGSVTWSNFSFIFFQTFFEHVPQNKLCESTNFIIFGLMDQKLWENKKFRRSLGKAAKC
jgi:hypothetical protein